MQRSCTTTASIVAQYAAAVLPSDPKTLDWRKKAFIRRVKGKAQLHVPRPTVAENLDPESFPEQLEQLAKEVTNFLRCLNEFPEFTDEAVNASILSFEGDLNVSQLQSDLKISLFDYLAILVLGIMLKGVCR